MCSDMQAPSESHSEGHLQCMGQLTVRAELDCDKLWIQDIRTAVAAVSHMLSGAMTQGSCECPG